ncbi:hypothetical protein GWI33_008604 [Rhynchophorus ferrugineus]|uniref:PHD and RING finger domain-containing protein 1 n=1 Tax=Rhynchophorus ferrugineus TaxID=354439 RepID=A0A834MC38_RHYFE|nr:hypothetical protein GWI33_008604 [Rhynchophorus ferrugineus]
MSSDESEVNSRHKRKRKIRRLPDDSPASTSSGSPIIGGTSYRRRNVGLIVEDSSDSENSDSSDIIIKRKKVGRLSNISDSVSDNDSSPIITARNRNARRVLISGSDSSSDDSDIVPVRRNRTAPLSMTDSDSDSQWESDFSDPENKASTSKVMKTSKDTVPEKSIDSDSSDGQSEKCPICLISFRLQEVGLPENCEHTFCLECIQEWSKNMNTCPVDRKEFNSITVKESCEGKILRTIPIGKPEPQNEMVILEDPTFCEICGSNDHEDRLLLCDGCDLGFHLYCLTPPLDEVPEGSWYCNDCGPSVNVNIDMEEIAGLFDDAEEHFGSHIVLGHRRPTSNRLIPRTRQSERVRRRIQDSRIQRQRQSFGTSDAIPSTSSDLSTRVRSNAVSSTTDEVTGEAVPVRKLVKRKRKNRRRKKKNLSPAEMLKKSVKARLAAQLGICAPRNVPQNLPDVRITATNTNNINQNRYNAESEDEGIYNENELSGTRTLMARRAPNAADVIALRRTVRRKAAIVEVPTVSSSTDVLSSIMSSQEKFLSKDAVMSVDSTGKVIIEKKKDSILNNNNLNKPNLNSYTVRETPYGNRKSTGSSGYSSNQNWSNSRMYRSMGSQDSSYYSASSSSYNQSNNSSGTNNVASGEQLNDAPQDYTQRTLSEAQMLQDTEDKKNGSAGSESDVDIYSDIENETVSTSKVEEGFKPPSPPSPPMAQIQNNTPNTDEDNDSESGMVIDTEKVSDENKEPVTSTVENTSEQAYSPERPTSSPGRASYSPGQPTDSPGEEAYSPERPTGDESTDQQLMVTDEIQSGTVQSTKNNAEDETHDNLEKMDEDEDSNDRCPNFSIYSRTSKSVALTTDITLNSSNSIKESSISGSSSQSESITNVSKIENATVSSELNSVTIEPLVEKINVSNTSTTESPEKEPQKTTSWNTGTLYSDSEDESIVKKNTNSFGISDIKDMTEDILSEEERSYTPLLDENNDKHREGLEGLDTELISDEDRNDFDESHELKTISDGDALEINAKESELDFTRPEEFEEGEIIDKNKDKTSAEQEVSAPEKTKDNEKAEDKDKSDKKDDSKKKKKIKSKDKDTNGIDKNGNKENENKQSAFKKLSKTNKDRNYRDKDKSKNKSRDRSRSKSPDKSQETKKRKEKRREIERYNVRALIAEKPRPPPKDQFGRDLRRSASRSRSHSRSVSYTPPLVGRSRSLSITRSRRSLSKRKSRSLTRSLSRGHRSLSRRRSKSKDKTSKRRGRSRNRKSASRSRSRSGGRRRRDRSKYKKRKRSGSKSGKRKKSKERQPNKNKKRIRTSKSRSRSKIRSRSRSVSPKRRRRDWTPSFSRSPSPQIHHVSPSWTPPRVENPQTLRSQNLTVILNNDAAKKRKKDKRNKDKRDVASKKRRRERDRTPPPSKEVFASGDNILVSVSFNNENETRDVTTRDRRRKDLPPEEPKKKKERRNRPKKDLSGIKPVAIIDLERSPFQEIVGSPKDVIILSDSDNNENENRNIQNICDSSQQVASPERSPNYTTGPKTPPEPSIKFSLIPKPPQLRIISNPLHEPGATTEEEMQNEVNNTPHKGPNTPPEEPPTSLPSSPDAYDPFEPTKSRSPTPEPNQIQNGTGNEPNHQESDNSKADLNNMESSAQTPDAIKSLTPPIADIQPADSQSSIQEISDSKSPDQQRIGVVINQMIQAPNSKPVAQTTPFSSVPSSIITTTAASNSLTTSRINFLSSTVITMQSNIPQRIVLPNQVKSSPVKIPPTKAAVKSTPIKPMQSKVNNKATKKNNRPQNGGSLEDVNLDFDSPYSPGSSDYEDLFEPPTEPAMNTGKTSKSNKSKTNNSQKQSNFDALFGGSPTFNKKKKGNKKSGSKTKHVGVKVDEDSLKILEELPNSAVEMQVKDKFLKKLNRQERVVEEVKLVLKPYYNRKKITKDEYKDIMRRAVPKICHNKSGEINPIKIRSLIEAYVKKIKHSKKVTSSSSLPQKVV